MNEHWRAAFALAAASACGIAESKPIAYAHGTTVMAEYGAGTMTELQVFYAPRYFLSAGAGYLTLESELDASKVDIAYARLNYLVKRWNLDDAQANVFAWGGAGNARIDDSRNELAWNAGMQFDFETPYRGFLNVAAYAYKEWQHDGFASTFPFQPIPNPSGNVNFDPTWAVEINYSQPLGFLPPWLPLKYKALVVMHGQKGCGEPCQPSGPGLLRTTEYLTQQILVFDVGQALWNLPQRWAIFGGYRWWKNKFGIAPDQPNGFFVGTTESTWLFGTAMKF